MLLLFGASDIGNNLLDNLITVVIGEYSEETYVWKNIPFPKNFNSDNSEVIINNKGNDEETKIIYKIHNNKKQYIAQSFTGVSHIPLFIFLKKLHSR